MLKTGEILIATDHQDYAKWIVSHIEQSHCLMFTETDFSNCPITKYHKKALKSQHEVRFFKVRFT